MTPAVRPPRPRRGRIATGAVTTCAALMISGCVIVDGVREDVEVKADPGAGDPILDAIADSARFSLAFAGDVHFERQIAGAAVDPEGLAALRPYFESADFAMVNLETAITEAATPMPGKNFTFSAPATALTALANAGIDAVSMANNHAVDFGVTGLVDTLEAKESGALPIVGVGHDADDAFAPLSVDLNGASVAVLAGSGLAEETYLRHAATDDTPGIADFVDPSRMLESVREADAGHDVVIAYMHMGAEGLRCVTSTDAEKVALLQGAGADIVILSHAHRLAGIDASDGAFVAYGLGNFVWYTGGRGKPSSHTGVLTVDVEVASPGATDPGVAVDGYDFMPLVIGSDGIPTPPATELLAQAISTEVAAVDTCA